jgi:hypothetical protein
LYTEEAEQTERGSESDRINRYTILCTSSEDRWCLAFQCEGVDDTGRCVLNMSRQSYCQRYEYGATYEIRVTGGPRSDEQDAIDDVRKTLDTGVVNSNNERTRPGITPARKKSGIVVWHKHGNNPNLSHSIGCQRGQ